MSFVVADKQVRMAYAEVECEPHKSSSQTGRVNNFPLASREEEGGEIVPLQVTSVYRLYFQRMSG